MKKNSFVKKLVLCFILVFAFSFCVTACKSEKENTEVSDEDDKDDDKGDDNDENDGENDNKDDDDKNDDNKDDIKEDDNKEMNGDNPSENKEGIKENKESGVGVQSDGEPDEERDNPTEVPDVTPDVKINDSELVGGWKLMTFNNGQVDVFSEKDIKKLEMLYAKGFYLGIVANADNTGFINVGEMNQQFTWDEKQITVKDESANYTVNGDTLIITDEGGEGKLTCERMSSEELERFRNQSLEDLKKAMKEVEKEASLDQGDPSPTPDAPLSNQDITGGWKLIEYLEDGEDYTQGKFSWEDLEDYGYYFGIIAYSDGTGRFIFGDDDKCTWDGKSINLPEEEITGEYTVEGDILRITIEQGRSTFIVVLKKMTEAEVKVLEKEDISAANKVLMALISGEEVPTPEPTDIPSVNNDMVGGWKLKAYSSDGEEMDLFLDKLEERGYYLGMIVNSDGTAELFSGMERTKLEWDDKVFSHRDQAVDYILSGDILTLKSQDPSDESVMTFVKMTDSEFQKFKNQDDEKLMDAYMEIIEEELAKENED